MNLFQLFWIISSIGSIAGFSPIPDQVKIGERLNTVASTVSTRIPAKTIVWTGSTESLGLERPLQPEPPALTLVAFPRFASPLQGWAVSSKFESKTAALLVASSNVAIDSNSNSASSSAEPALSRQIVRFVENLSRWSEGVSAALRLTNQPLVAIATVHPLRESPASAVSDSPDGEGKHQEKKSLGQPAEQASDPNQANQAAQTASSEQPNEQPNATSADLAESSNDCLSLSKAVAQPDQQPKQMFQIKVKGKVVAEVFTQDDADALAQRFEQVLQTPGFDPSTLYPAIVNSEAVGKAGETVLFSIDPRLAAQFDRNPELIAIAWINNLRSALDASPLPLSEAQSQMLRLKPTRKHLKGNASWYDSHLEGQLTATGEVFNTTGLTAAHPSLPFGTYLKVTNLRTGNAVIVRVNDRGPYLKDRSLDLSPEAAHCLDSKTSGVVPYEAVVMKPDGTEASNNKASAPASTEQAQAASAETASGN